MNKPIKRFLVPLVILLLGISVSGCAPLIIGGAAGAYGGYEYRKGQELKRDAPKPTTSSSTTGRNIQSSK